MNIHEYQAKELLGRYGVTVLQGHVAWTPEEAAEALGIGRTQIYELIANGALKSVKIGRSRRIPVRACEEFVERLRANAQELPIRTARTELVINRSEGTQES